MWSTKGESGRKGGGLTWLGLGLGLGLGLLTLTLTLTLTSWAARAEQLQREEREAREEGFFVRPLPRATARSLQLLELRLGAPS